MRSLVSIAAILSATAAPAFAAPNVVTDMSPTGALVQEVMGDLGQVHVLLPKGASAHHYTMRPSDARALQNADLLVWMGPQLTPWLDRSADNLSGDTQQLRLLTVEGTILQEYADDDHEGHDHEAHDDHDEHEGHDHDDHHEGHDDHEHHDEHGHDDHDGEGHGDHAGDHEGHDHSGIDPHAWLNPENAAPWLAIIADTLSEQDPENAATYRANAETAADRIAALDADLKTQMAPFSETSFVVFHDAYNYFTRHYGLKSAVAVSLGDATTPSAARVQAVRDKVVKTQAVCAFPEYAHDPALLNTVTEGTDTRIGAELSPEGADGGIGLFDDTFNGLAQTLITCFEDK
ncbi:zinc ABC transporter substrate-binding protein [Paracoccus sp. JM45]|uniref:zinc ABC transporter substrate-binding protein n=1 Tax=Paracoccus sp. JM45 TaxID=2283626 RepID=UPI000E6C48BF|nr:zinc ABC transporter substrate-binding protein [Paracoccus sp. JM45]RJE81692.1 zinc ABC transporter substrate-binding protein [Paracoccus sp. JM45]